MGASERRSFASTPLPIRVSPEAERSAKHTKAPFFDTLIVPLPDPRLDGPSWLDVRGGRRDGEAFRVNHRGGIRYWSPRPKRSPPTRAHLKSYLEDQLMELEQTSADETS